MDFLSRLLGKSPPNEMMYNGSANPGSLQNQPSENAVVKSKVTDDSPAYDKITTSASSPVVLDNTKSSADDSSDSSVDYGSANEDDSLCVAFSDIHLNTPLGKSTADQSIAFRTPFDESTRGQLIGEGHNLGQADEEEGLPIAAQKDSIPRKKIYNILTESFESPSTTLLDDSTAANPHFEACEIGEDPLTCSIASPQPSHLNTTKTIQEKVSSSPISTAEKSSLFPQHSDGVAIISESYTDVSIQKLIQSIRVDDDEDINNASDEYKLGEALSGFKNISYTVCDDGLDTVSITDSVDSETRPKERRESESSILVLETDVAPLLGELKVLPQTEESEEYPGANEGVNKTLVMDKEDKVNGNEITDYNLSQTSVHLEQFINKGRGGNETSDPANDSMNFDNQLDFSVSEELKSNASNDANNKVDNMNETFDLDAANIENIEATIPTQALSVSVQELYQQEILNNSVNLNEVDDVKNGVVLEVKVENLDDGRIEVPQNIMLSEPMEYEEMETEVICGVEGIIVPISGDAPPQLFDDCEPMDCDDDFLEEERKAFIGSVVDEQDLLLNKCDDEKLEIDRIVAASQQITDDIIKASESFVSQEIAPHDTTVEIIADDGPIEVAAGCAIDTQENVSMKSSDVQEITVSVSSVDAQQISSIQVQTVSNDLREHVEQDIVQSNCEAGKQDLETVDNDEVKEIILPNSSVILEENAINDMLVDKQDSLVPEQHFKAAENAITDKSAVVQEICVPETRIEVQENIEQVVKQETNLPDNVCDVENKVLQETVEVQEVTLPEIPAVMEAKPMDAQDLKAVEQPIELQDSVEEQPIIVKKVPTSQKPCKMPKITPKKYVKAPPSEENPFQTRSKIRNSPDRSMDSDGLNNSVEFEGHTVAECLQDEVIEPVLTNQLDTTCVLESGSEGTTDLQDMKLDALSVASDLSAASEESDAFVTKSKVEPEADAFIMKCKIEQEADPFVVKSKVEQKPDAFAPESRIEQEADAFVTKSKIEQETDPLATKSKIEQDPDAFVVKSEVEQKPDAFAPESRIEQGADAFVTKSKIEQETDPLATKSKIEQKSDAFAPESKIEQEADAFATKSKMEQEPDPFATKSKIEQEPDPFATESKIEQEADAFATISKMEQEPNPFATKSKIANSPEKDMDETLKYEEYEKNEDLYDQTLKVKDNVSADDDSVQKDPEVVNSIFKEAKNLSNKLLSETEKNVSPKGRVLETPEKVISPNETVSQSPDDISKKESDLTNKKFNKEIAPISPVDIKTNCLDNTPKSTKIVKAESSAACDERRPGQLLKRNISQKLGVKPSQHQLSPMTRSGDLMGMSPLAVGENVVQHAMGDFQRTILDDDDGEVFKTPAEVFKDPLAFEFLLQAGSGTGEPCKDSFLVKFDPLVGGAPRLPQGLRGQAHNAEVEGAQEEGSTASGLAESCSSDSSLCTSISHHSETNKPAGTMSSVEQSLGALSLQCQQAAAPSANTNSNSNSTPPSSITTSLTDKPTQVVSPAISTRQQYTPAQHPNRCTPGPTKSTSSALAAIDRLISLGGSTPPPPPPVVQPKEAEMDGRMLQELGSVREALARQEEELRALQEKEQRSSRELAEGRQREQALIDRLNEKTRDRRQMDVVMEEYEHTMSQFIAERELEKRQWEEERRGLLKERDEVTSHLFNTEHAFNDIHMKYERCKTLINGYKTNEEILKQSLQTSEEANKKQLERYEQLRQHAMTQLDIANQEMDGIKRSNQAEITRLQAMLKKSDIQLSSMQESLAQKVKDIEDLTAICDELINKVR